MIVLVLCFSIPSLFSLPESCVKRRKAALCHTRNDDSGSGGRVDVL
jgi:hypothetical protein